MLIASLTPTLAVLVVAYFMFVYVPGRRYDRKVAAARAQRGHTHAAWGVQLDEPELYVPMALPEAQYDRMMRALPLPPALPGPPQPPADPQPYWQVAQTGVYEHTFTWGAPEVSAARDVT